jgi:hypothetical protein
LADYKQCHRSSGSDTALDECTNQLKLRIPQHALFVFIRDDSWIDLIAAMPFFHSKAVLVKKHRQLALFPLA